MSYGPPAPDWVWPGAPAARDAHAQASFQQELAAAPAEVDGACVETVGFEGIGDACRTEDGLLRVELEGGGDMLTHGPDFVDAASDLTPSTTTPSVVAAVQNATKADVSCVPAAEPHTQLIYAIPADGADRATSKVDAFRQSTYEASAVMDNTSRMLSTTAGRRLRVACDGSGDASVLTMRLPRRASAYSFSTVRSDVEAEYATTSNVGNATKVRYLVYYDAHLDGFSGVGSMFNDVDPSASNDNNRSEAFALQDNSSGTGPSWYVLLHEISHNMGAVQDGAPDSNEVSHCNDGRDVMCYAEPGTTGVSGTYSSTTCIELQFDCDHDSYFHPAPNGGWLAANWNVAATANRYLDSYAAPADSTAPATPTGLAGIGHGDFIRLTWNAVADADLHTYRIERDIGAGVWRTVGDAWPGETTFDATWTGITLNTTYALRVRAYDRRGNLSAESTSITVDTGVTDAEVVTPGGPALPEPINAAVVSSTASSITFRWDAPQAGGAAGWEVDKEHLGGWRQAQWSSGSASGTVTFSTDVYGDPLDPGTRYQYRIRLTDGWGRQSPSVTIAGWTRTAPDVTAPTAPSGLQVASSSGTSPSLTWSPVGDAEDYVVAVETSPGSGSWTQQAIVTSPAHTLSGLANATTHSIGVVARDEAGNESPRSTVSFAAPAARSIQAPTAPSIDNQTFSMTYTTIGYSWAASTDDGAVSYRMLYTPDANPVDWFAGPTTTALSGTITGLSPGTTYRVTVEAFDADGHASMHGGGSYFLPTTTADGTAPTQPPSLTASQQTTTSMQLDWGISTDGQSGVAGYRVYRTNPGGEQLLTTTAPGVRTFTPTGLSQNTSYTFAVEAFDVANNSSTRQTVTSSTTAPPDVTPPTSPTTFVHGTLTETSAPVSWSGATDNVAVTGYRIYRMAPSASGTAIATFGAVTNATLASLAPATTYTFEIEAVDGAGLTSSPRTSLSFTTPDLTPPSWSGVLSASDTTSSSTHLAWDAATDNAGVVSYRVRRVSPDPLDLTTTTGLSFDAVGLGDATEYQFAIIAVDGAGLETASNTVTVTSLDGTAPTQPGAVTAGAATSTSVQLSWGSSTDNVDVTGYRVHSGSDTTGTLLHTTPSTTQTISNLQPMTTYTFAIVARDAIGNTSSARTITTSTTDDVAPSTPANLRTTGRTGSTISLAWDASTDDVRTAGYRLYQVVGGVDTLVTGVTGTTHSVTGLSDATDYSYKVESFDAMANTSMRSAAHATFTSDTQSPTQPGALQVGTVTGTSIAFTWTASSDARNPITYELRRDSAVGTLLKSTTALGATVTGLDDGVMHHVFLVARDPSNNVSAPRDVQVATTDATAPTEPVFLLPSNVTTSGMRLAWDPSTDAGGIAGYELERLVGAAWTLVAPRTSLLLLDLTGLAAGTSHSFRLRAVDATGNRSSYATVTVATNSEPDVTAPTTPAQPVAAGATTDGTVTVAWGASTDASGIAGYHVSRLTTGGYILQGTTATTSISLSGQPIGTSATYAIAAVDTAGNISTPLIVAVAIPAPAPPPPPTTTPPPTPPPPAAIPASGLIATITSTRITLAWQQSGTTTTGWRIVEIRGGRVVSTRDVTTPTATYGRYAPKTSVRFALYSLAGVASSSAVTLDATTAADRVRPTRPGRFRAVSPARGTLALTWFRSRDDVRLRGYEVRLSTRRVKARIVRLRATATRTRIARLRSRAPYVVQIRAVDVAGNASAWITLRTRTR